MAGIGRTDGAPSTAPERSPRPVQRPELPGATAAPGPEAPIDGAPLPESPRAADAAAAPHQPLAAPRPSMAVPRSAPTLGEERAFRDWLGHFEAEVRAQTDDTGAPLVSEETLRSVLRGVSLQPESRAPQPEFAVPPSQYLADRLPHVAPARAALEGLREVEAFQQGTAASRVPLEVAVATWSVESSRGRFMGRDDLFSTLASRAFREDTSANYTHELRDALMLVERGHLARGAQGSSAGALGHPQFLPSSWLDLAVDGDGDGDVDLVDPNDPADAIGSIRNYLANRGDWVAEQPPYVDARLPADFEYSQSGFSLPGETMRTVADWQAMGVEFDHPGLDPNWRVDIDLPEGHEGPAFGAFENFSAIRTYNRSDNYARSVAAIAMGAMGRPLQQELIGATGLSESRDDRGDFQELVGAVRDTFIGRGTTHAAQAVQQRYGEAWGPADGFADRAFLERLRDELEVVETHLHESGHLSRPPGRELNDGTRAAVRAYAEAHGMAADAGYRDVANAVIDEVGIEAVIGESPANAVAPAEDAAAGQNAEYREFVARLRNRALAEGVSAERFDAVFGPDGPAFELDPVVMRLQQPSNQPEFRFSMLGYLDRQLGDDEFRVEQGRDVLGGLSPDLEDAIRAHGASPEDIIPIWGGESSYGANLGSMNVFRSAATLAYARESEFWHNQVMAAFRISEREGLAPEDMLGSWAAAMGHTQFIPTTLEDYARDGDGDGVRDLRGSVHDGLASAANYLRALGLEPEEPAIREVLVPEGFDFSLADGETARTVGQWRALGVEFMSPTEGDEALRDDLPARLALTDRHEGPIFARFGNWSAYRGYNPADSYATKMSVMRERLHDVPFGPWLTEPPLSVDEREFLQEVLEVAVDGVIGPGTGRAYRAAIRDYAGEVPELERRIAYPTRAWLGRLAEAQGMGHQLPAPPLDRSERLELQRYLTDADVYSAGLDGVLGSGSDRGIEQMESVLGVGLADGYRAVLEAFRARGG